MSLSEGENRRGLPTLHDKFPTVFQEQHRSPAESVYFTAGYVPESHKYLLEAGETVTDALIMRVGKDRWVREYAPRFERGRGVVDVSNTSPETVKHSAEDFYFLGLMEVAKRAMHSYKDNLVYAPDGSVSAYAKQRFFAANFPLFWEHGDSSHIRRVARQLQKTAANIPELREARGLNAHILNGVHAFVFEHDRDQMSWIYRNYMARKAQLEPPIQDVKTGHEIAAAVMFMATLPEYAKARYGSWNNETKAMAQKDAGIFMFLAADHDTPDVYREAIKCREKASPNEDIDVLYQRFKEGTVDRATITWSQWMKMLIKEKGKGAFITTDNPYGLDPEFVLLYNDRLEELLHNHNPILPDLSEEERNALELWALAVNDADVIEYSTPAGESIERKLGNKRAEGRPFWLADTKRLMRDVNVFREQRGESLFDEQTDPVEVIIYGITQCPSLPYGDAFRSLWELNVLEDYGYPYWKKRNRNAAVLGALTLRNFGKKLLRGDVSEIEKMDYRNVARVGEKLLRKSKTTVTPTGEEVEVQGVPEAVIAADRARYSDPQEYLNFLLLRLNQENPDRVRAFEGVIAGIRLVEQGVFENFSRKISILGPTRPTNHVRVMAPTGLLKERAGEFRIEIYDTEQQDLFERVIARFIEIICKKYEVTPQMLAWYEQLAENGEYMPDYPLYTYYSGADAAVDPNRLYQPGNGVQQLITEWTTYPDR